MIWWFLTPILLLIIWLGISVWWFMKKFNVVDFRPQAWWEQYAMIPVIVLLIALDWADTKWKKYGKYVWR